MKAFCLMKKKHWGRKSAGTAVLSLWRSLDSDGMAADATFPPEIVLCSLKLE